jgi:uncharacterized DUF497 family protein
MAFGSFDPIKSDKNKLERGIDFIEAQAIWLDPSVRRVEAKTVSGEIRYATIGFIGENLWVAIWTDISLMGSIPGLALGEDHEPVIRIISVHRAEKTKFERIYYDQV